MCTRLRKKDEIVLHTPKEVKKRIALRIFEECLKCESESAVCKPSYSQYLYQSDYNIDPNKFGNILEFINPNMVLRGKSHTFK